MHLGDFLPGQLVSLPWSTNSKTGGSISRATLGAISARRASVGSVSSVGITDNADLGGLVGVHHCTISLANGFYAPHDEYLVLLQGALIDGETVNAVLGSFSILNRSHTRLWVAGTVDISAFTPTQIEFECSDITTEAANNNLAGRSVYPSVGGLLLKQVGVIESSSLSGAGKGHIVIPAGAALTAALANGDRIVIV